MPGPRFLIVSVALLVLLVPAAAGAQQAGASTNTLAIAQDGHSQYQIVLASNASEVDRYAARELAGYLGQITGATLPLVAATDYDDDKPTVFVGLSKPARARLDETAIGTLEPQQYAVLSIGMTSFSLAKACMAA